MLSIVRSEWAKLRRCQILLVGVVALALCPLVQYGTQLVIEPAQRDPDFNMAKLFSAVVWGNTQIFLPISLVMIGGWLIDRETNQDTMKNLVTVPLSMPALLGGKLIVVAGLAGGFGLYSGAVTVAAGAVFGLPGMSLPAVLGGCGQIFAAALTTCVVCLPLVMIFGQIPGAYLAGSIATFFGGYCILFFKSGVLLSAYPFSAALVLVGFDMASYNGALEAPNPLLSLAGFGATAALSVLLLALSGRQRELRAPRRKARRPASRRMARR